MAGHFVESDLSFDPRGFKKKTVEETDDKSKETSGFDHDAQQFANENCISTALARAMLDQMSH